MKISKGHNIPAAGLVAPIISNIGVWFFALFLFAGYFKADDRLAFVQERIDITLLLLSISVLVFLYQMIRNSFNLLIPCGFIWSALLFLLLGAIFIAGLLHTQNTHYGLDKTMRFIFLTGWAFFGAVFFVTDFLSLKHFSWAVVAISTAMAIDALLSYSMGQVTFVTSLGSNYIALARATGLGLLTIVAFLLPAKQNIAVRFVLCFLATLNLFAALASGARGPVIALIISMVLFFLLSIHGFPRLRVERFVFKLGVVALLAGILLAVAGQELFPTLAYRYQILLTEVGDSAATRLSFYQVAFDQWAKSPLWGGGTGQFGAAVTGEDVRLYPHNIFLELGAETGLLGVLVFTTLVCHSFIKGLICMYKRKSSFRISCRYLLVAFCFLLVNAMVSGDINDNRMLFCFITLLVATNRFDSIRTNSLCRKSMPRDQLSGR
ncbi:MAG: O-antigen ligase family protein [Candidatus Methanosuratincola petrocarbonis]